jgi:hypothetical protein
VISSPDWPAVELWYDSPEVANYFGMLPHRRLLDKDCHAVGEPHRVYRLGRPNAKDLVDTCRFECFSVSNQLFDQLFAMT